MADKNASGASSGTLKVSKEAIEREVADALSLLDYAVANGIKTPEGVRLSPDIVTALKNAAAEVLNGSGPISAADWAAFELAYYDLALAMAPVTAETLRNTATTPRSQRSWHQTVFGDSPAIQFTRVLWLLTLSFAAFVLGSSWYQAIIAIDGDAVPHLWGRTLSDIMTPWAYGGLGACVYLLRSAHVYVYQRCFDVRRKPEYFNRILLGAVAGGAILLFVAQVTDDDGTVVKLSSAALGFLAGYNTDFLFQTIERVAQAILPKVGFDSVKRADAATQPADLNDLVARMDKATGAEKEFYKSLIGQLTGARQPPQPAS